MDIDRLVQDTPPYPLLTAMRAVPIYDSIICFGDSLTQQASQKGGFVASLQDAYQRRLEGESCRVHALGEHTC